MINNTLNNYNFGVVNRVLSLLILVALHTFNITEKNESILTFLNCERD